MPYEAFDDAIKKAGEETALHADLKCNYWFQFNADELTPATKGTRPTSACSRSPADLPPSIVDYMRTQLKCLNKHVKDKVLITKARWAAHICSKIHNM